MKRFLPLATIIVALLVILFVVRRCTSSGGGGYQTATVTKGPITQLVTATGTLNPVTNVQVGSQVSGNIQKLFADFNSEVKAGQTVAQIDPAIFQATVTQAEGDLATAQAALELAKVNAARTQRLFAEKNSSQQDVDSAMATLHQGEGNVQINSNVAEADVGAVEVGQAVDFTVDAFPARTFHGKVVQVRNAPITVQNVVTYDTVIGVDNNDLKLKPGMTANVSIIIAHKDDVLQLKNAALRFRPPEAAAEPRTASAPRGARPGGSPGGQRPTGARERKPERTVYVLSLNQPKPAQLKTGISDGIVTEVTEGLKEGDKVVTAELSSAMPSNSPSTNPFGGGRRFP